MFSPPKTPACRACARAKRKCDKAQPACQRCRDRQMACKYPPSRPSRYVAVGELPAEVAVPTIPTSTSLSSWALEPSEHLELVESLEPKAFTALPWPSLKMETLPWLDPSSWAIDHRVRLHISPDDVDFLRIQISGIRAWLKTWVTTGTCPFIHHELYQPMPPNVQTAFLTMSSYIHRTEATAGIVMDAVDSQAAGLLLQEALSDDMSVGQTADLAGLSALDHLARVHALVVYQVIGLFDGNVRARHLADVRRPTLCRWARQMVEAVAGLAVGPAELAITSPGATHWSSWILVETARRTWVVAAVVEAIYHTLKHGWSPPTGSLKCTARHGVWQARTEQEWQAAVESDSLSNLADLEAHLSTDAADVDVFSRALMSSAYGRQRVKAWEASSRDVATVHH